MLIFHQPTSTTADHMYGWFQVTWPWEQTTPLRSSGPLVPTTLLNLQLTALWLQKPPPPHPPPQVFQQLLLVLATMPQSQRLPALASIPPPIFLLSPSIRPKTTPGSTTPLLRPMIHPAPLNPPPPSTNLTLTKPLPLPRAVLMNPPRQSPHTLAPPLFPNLAVLPTLWAQCLLWLLLVSGHWHFNTLRFPPWKFLFYLMLICPL